VSSSPRRQRQTGTSPTNTEDQDPFWRIFDSEAFAFGSKLEPNNGIGHQSFNLEKIMERVCADVQNGHCVSFDLLFRVILGALEIMQILAHMNI